MKVKFQLIAVLLVALIAVGAVSIVSVIVIVRERAAADHLALLSRTQRILQDADREHDAIRADVLAIDNSWASRSPDQLQQQLDDDIERYRAFMLQAGTMPLDPGLHKAIVVVEPDVDTYLRRANDLGRLAPGHPGSVSDKGRAFRESSDRLSADNKQLIDLFSSRVSDAAAVADSAARKALWAIGIASCSALLVVAIVGRVGTRRVSDMADSMQTMVGRLQAEQEQDAFSRHLSEALDMADSEAETHLVVGRGMAAVAGDMPMELLVADSSRAHLERAAEHPRLGPPGCDVASPFGCMAVRRGTPIVFETSEALNACSHLRGRAAGALSAVCVPLSFMGRSLGVLHATGRENEAAPPTVVSQLTTLGILSASRIGTVRAFERTQVQARTDGLTGLANRRAFESRVRKLGSAVNYAFVLADLDHFKRLNDKHGHDAGDHALKVFADVLRQSLRDGDLCARWGGEEFGILLEGRDAAGALAIVTRIRDNMATGMQGAPSVTASFGIADSTMADAFEDLLKIADDALYDAKENGRDRASIGNPARLAGGLPRRRSDQSAQVSVSALDEESSSAA